MKLLSRPRSYRPPYLVSPAVVAAMSTDAVLPKTPRLPAVDPVRVLDWPADVELPAVPAFAWDEPGAAS